MSDNDTRPTVHAPEAEALAWAVLTELVGYALTADTAPDPRPAPGRPGDGAAAPEG